MPGPAAFLGAVVGTGAARNVAAGAGGVSALTNAQNLGDVERGFRQLNAQASGFSSTLEGLAQRSGDFSRVLNNSGVPGLENLSGAFEGASGKLFNFSRDMNEAAGQHMAELEASTAAVTSATLDADVAIKDAGNTLRDTSVAIDDAGEKADTLAGKIGTQDGGTGLVGSMGDMIAAGELTAKQVAFGEASVSAAFDLLGKATDDFKGKLDPLVAAYLAALGSMEEDTKLWIQRLRELYKNGLPSLEPWAIDAVKWVGELQKNIDGIDWSNLYPPGPLGGVDIMPDTGRIIDQPTPPGGGYVPWAPSAPIVKPGRAAPSDITEDGWVNDYVERTPPRRDQPKDRPLTRADFRRLGGG